MFPPLSDAGLSKMVREIQCATRLLLSMDTSTLRDVEIAFKPSRLSTLGSWLSSDGASTDVCKALEGALLRFRRHRVVVSPSERKARTVFWSTAIRNAFPRLNEQELLTFSPQLCEYIQNYHPIQRYYNAL